MNADAAAVLVLKNETEVNMVLCRKTKEERGFLLFMCIFIGEQSFPNSIN